jgi:hypothetical protein
MNISNDLKYLKAFNDEIKIPTNKEIKEIVKEWFVSGLIPFHPLMEFEFLKHVKHNKELIQNRFILFLINIISKDFLFLYPDSGNDLLDNLTNEFDSIEVVSSYKEVLL